MPFVLLIAAIVVAAVLHGTAATVAFWIAIGLGSVLLCVFLTTLLISRKAYKHVKNLHDGHTFRGDGFGRF